MANDKNNALKEFHRDKRNARVNETIGGGFIVARRGRGSGRFRMHQWPFEHDSYESAETEAKRLAEKHAGREFAVLQQVSPAFAVPEPLPSAEEHENA